MGRNCRALEFIRLFVRTFRGKRLMNDIFPMYQQHVRRFKWILETIRNRPCPNHGVTKARVPAP